MKIPGYQLDKQLNEEDFNYLLRVEKTSTLSSEWLKVNRINGENFNHSETLKNDHVLSVGLNQYSKHILKPLEFKQHADIAYIRYENFDAISLQQLFDQGSLELKDCIQISLNLLDAVDDIHHQNVVHGNLNAFNILINPHTFELKLSDFRFSCQCSCANKLIFSEHKTGIHLAYISPEQTGRLNRISDYRSDYYSLGILFYEMLCDKLPFESLDSMELIHSHIARQAVSPYQLLPYHCPEAISDIVMKLLAKTPEDRYQSIDGIKYDLKYCQQQLKQGNSITAFQLAEFDFSTKLNQTSTLFGREEQIQRLQQKLDQLKQGQGSFVTISGSSGMGKTSLIEKLMLTKNSDLLFVRGKYEQYDNIKPFSACIQIVSALIDYALSESETIFLQLQKALKDSLANNASVITELVASFELILGDQPPPLRLSDQENENRFNTVLNSFFSVFSHNYKPLVILLDDLQWADPSSLILFENFLGSEWAKKCLLIACYRNDDKSNNKALNSILKKQSDLNAITEIILNNLSSNDVQQLLSQTFAMTDEEVLPLAKAIFMITQGNPFYTKQLLSNLYDEKSIWVDTNSHKWCWKIDSLLNQKGKLEEDQGISNLVNTMLQGLSEQQLVILYHGLHLGRFFSLTNLSMVLNLKEDELIKLLSPLLKIGLLTQDGHFYYFSHNRLQQFVAKLMPEKQKTQAHLNIARQFLRHLDEKEKNNRLLEITNHSNIVSHLLTKQDEQRQLLSLNYLSAKKLLASCAYALALSYITKAKSILSKLDDKIVSFYRYKVTLLLAKCLYLVGQYAHAKLTIDELLKQNLNFKQQVLCYSVYKATLLSEGSNYKGAVSLGINILVAKGYRLSTDSVQLNQQVNDLQKQIALLLQDKQIADLVNGPALKDKDQRLLLTLFADLWEAAYYETNQLLMIFCTLSSVKLSIEYGNSNESAFGFVLYGMTLTLDGQYSQAYEFGQLALELNNKYENKILLPKVTNLFCNYINYYVKPFASSIDLYENASLVGQNNGDYLFGLWASFFVIWSRFLSGQNLVEVRRRSDELAFFIRQTHDDKMIYAYDVLNNVIESLLGSNTKEQVVKINKYPSYRSYWKENEFPQGLSWQAILLGQYYCVMGDYQQAYEILNDRKLVLSVEIVMFPHSQFSFYHVLSLLRLLNNKQLSLDSEMSNHIDEAILRLSLWAQSCPENFLFQWLLLKAEKYSLENDLWMASSTYNKAIDAAEKYKLLPAMALSNELLGLFYQQQDNPKLALYYLRSGLNYYKSWGAIAKFDRLQLLIKHISAAENNIAVKTKNKTDLLALADKKALELDFNSVLKFTLAISEEIDSERLLNKAMQIIIENAGADRAALLTHIDNQLLISLIAEYQQQASIDKLDIALDNFNQLPKGIIHYVARTKKQLLINDALVNESIQDKNYIRRNAIHSILCLPIIYKDQLNAILYLENHLSGNVFNQDRANKLRILLTQLEVSLHNAKLYKSLKIELQKHQQTTKALMVSESRLKLSHKYAKIGVWEWNIETGNIFWSENVSHMLGYSEEKFDLSLDSFMQILHPDDKEKVENAINACINEGEEYQVEHRVIWADGSIHWMSEEGNVSRDKQGKAISMLGIIKDITQRKEQEVKQLETVKQLHQAQKMEAIGQLTGGIAHDFNNMLASILGYSELLKLQFSPLTDEKPLKYVEQIITSGNRAAKLIAQMLSYSRGGKANREVVDIAPLVEDVIQLLLSTIPRSIKIDFQYDKKLPKVKLNVTQLNQIIMNICINARDAFAGKQGEIKINISSVKQLNTSCSSCHKMISGDFIDVSISDNAGGIAENIRHSIFNPFFTTKELGKGTGMGLAMVHGIMHGHHGHIILEVDPMQGSLFRLFFPLSRQQKKFESVKVKKRKVALQENIRVLVVDDEPALAVLISEQLNLEGCKVTTCTDAVEALKLIENNLADFDILISDQTMPDYSGTDLASRALSIDADFPVIICSGYSELLNTEIVSNKGIKKLLTKPVPKKVLIKALNDLIPHKNG